jgi:hypothetical protein
MEDLWLRADVVAGLRAQQMSLDAIPIWALFLATTGRRKD